MSNIEKLLTDRNLPDLLKGAEDVKSFEQRQNEIKQLLSEREYGEIPPKPEHMSVDITSTYENFACGKAVRNKLTFKFIHGGEEFSFPAMSVIPKSKEKTPAFVYIGFEQGEAGKYMPTEEIVERGFALFSFCYTDATSDNDDFQNGVAKYLVRSRRKSNAPGKIALWAWCAMRVMDYIETLADVIDLENVAVIGHSRLGKTALLTGGFDQRFKYVISNDSGCAGAAIERGKVGERYDKISNVFPYWFCPRFNEDAANGVDFPFDQSYLLSLSVPRHVIVGSAVEDLWADPVSEFLGAASLRGAYELYGLKGLLHNDEIPTPRTVLSKGEVAYYVRPGTHYLSRHDWNTYMDIIGEWMGK